MKETFFDSFSKLLGQNLKKFEDERNLDRTTCIAIFTTIYDTVMSIVTLGDVKISNEAINWMAQQYYDGIVINGRQELDPSIFSKRASLKEISNRDLTTLLAFLDGTDFKLEVIAELKGRS